ncbi:MAG: dienelactone hydrolase family protein, partial [Bacteroidetes bacterium]|nr:dienelactone hydrolase family protein [Bacteroidota bacterium]
DEAQGAVLYYGNEGNDVDQIEGKVPFPVMAIIADRDDWKDPEVAKNFERDLREAAEELVVHFYETDRRLDNPQDPTADMEASKKAYKQSLFFLKRALD